MLISLEQPELALANNYCMYKLGLYQTVQPMCIILHDNAAWNLKSIMYW